MVRGINDIVSRIQQINDRIHEIQSMVVGKTPSSEERSGGTKARQSAPAGGKSFEEVYQEAASETQAEEGLGKGYSDVIKRASGKTGIDESLIRAVIKQESGFHPRAVSPKGAMGLMQLMPETARELGVEDPFDPEENVEGGARYLKKMLHKYSGNLNLALAAYNAGPKRVDDAGGVPKIRETEDYVKKVLKFYKKYQQKI